MSKLFAALLIKLEFLFHNYFEGSTKLFFSTQVLNTSAKSFFFCVGLRFRLIENIHIYLVCAINFLIF